MTPYRAEMQEIVEYAIEIGAGEADEPIDVFLNRCIAGGRNPWTLASELGLPNWRIARQERLRKKLREQALAIRPATGLTRLACRMADEKLDPAAVTIQHSCVGRWGEVGAVGDGEGSDHIIIGRRWNADETGWMPGPSGHHWRLIGIAPTTGAARAIVAGVAHDGTDTEPYTFL